jgi:hypothetical protein
MFPSSINEAFGAKNHPIDITNAVNFLESGSSLGR